MAVAHEENQNQQHTGQKIHQRASGQNQCLCPKALPHKGPLIAGILILPLHGAEAANGKQPQGIQSFPFLESPQFGAHANGKLVDTNFRRLCQQEMAQLVKKYHEPEKQYANDN